MMMKLCMQITEIFLFLFARANSGLDRVWFLGRVFAPCSLNIALCTFCELKQFNNLKLYVHYISHIFGAKIQIIRKALQIKMSKTSRMSEASKMTLFALDQPDYEATYILKYFWRENSNNFGLPGNWDTFVLDQPDYEANYILKYFWREKFK